MRKTTPPIEHALAMLRDGPRDLVEVVTECSAFVPPGVAMRRFTRNGSKPNAGKGHRKMTEADMIRSGAEWVVRSGLRQMVLRDRMRTYDDGRSVVIALTDVGRAIYLGEPSPLPKGVDPGWKKVEVYAVGRRGGRRT